MINKLRKQLIETIYHDDFDEMTKGELVELLLDLAISSGDVNDEDWIEFVNQSFINSVNFELEFQNMPLMGTPEFEVVEMSNSLGRLAVISDFGDDSEIKNQKMLDDAINNIANGDHLRRKDLH